MKKSEMPLEYPLGTQIDLISKLIAPVDESPIEPSTELYKPTPERKTPKAEKLVLKKVNPKETGTKTIPLALEQTMLLKIDEIAIKTGKTRTELMRILLDYALEHLILE